MYLLRKKEHSRLTVGKKYEVIRTEPARREGTAYIVLDDQGEEFTAYPESYSWCWEIVEGKPPKPLTHKQRDELARQVRVKEKTLKSCIKKARDAGIEVSDMPELEITYKLKY